MGFTTARLNVNPTQIGRSYRIYYIVHAERVQHLTANQEWQSCKEISYHENERLYSGDDDDTNGHPLPLYNGQQALSPISPTTVKSLKPGSH